MAIHRDEGHISEEGEEVVNYHAHIEFMGLDAEGNSVRKKLTKGNLSKLQSHVAKLLGMERGTNYAKEEKRRPKRLDTYEYKAHRTAETKTVNAKTKDLKAEIKNLKIQLADSHAERETYAELEQLNRDLKERIRAKDLTIDQLREELSNFCSADAMPIQKEGLTNFEELELENTSLKAENQALKHEISTLPSQDTFNDLKERLKAFEDAVAINQALVPLEVENERLRKQLKLLEDEEFKPFKLGRGDLLLKLKTLEEQLMSYEINDGLDIDIAEGIAMSQDKTTPTPHGF